MDGVTCACRPTADRSVPILMAELLSKAVLALFVSAPLPGLAAQVSVHVSAVTDLVVNALGNQQRITAGMNMSTGARLSASNQAWCNGPSTFTATTTLDVVGERVSMTGGIAAGSEFSWRRIVERSVTIDALGISIDLSTSARTNLLTGASSAGSVSVEFLPTGGRVAAYGSSCGPDLVSRLFEELDPTAGVIRRDWVLDASS